MPSEKYHVDAKSPQAPKVTKHALATSQTTGPAEILIAQLKNVVRLAQDHIKKIH